MTLPTHLLQILQSCRTLPSVPAVAMQVLDLSQDPDVGTAKVAKAIARDPALTAKILKVANSAWCGIRREVTTLDQAVSLLGLNGTMSLALSFSLVRGLQKKTNAKTFDHQAYWWRSVTSAAATLSVGTCIKAAPQEELFLAGLLQDIGMLALNEAMPTYGALVASANREHDMLVEIERRNLLTDHAEVGAWFLKKWGLPSRLIEAVGVSHDRENIGQPLARSVAVGSRIADIWVSPNTASATASAAEIVEALLRLSPHQFDQVLAKTAADLPEITENLDIEVGNEALVSGMLDQAREAITELNLRALQEARSLAIQAQRDSLTSLYNRTHLNRVLEEEFTRSRTMAEPLTVIFIDIDEFKSINDTYGHQGGDAILISVSQAIRSAAREDDTIIRFGGDEFVVLLANTGEGMAAEIAERIRSTVEEQLHDAGDSQRIIVTVSVGWATVSSGSSTSSAKELLECADRSLYAAKTAGRNRVAHAV
jgi:diguanylate cyclase (GGDEF)-like protein